MDGAVGRFVGSYYPVGSMSVKRSVMKGCVVGVRRWWRLDVIVGRLRRRCFVLRRRKKWLVNGTMRRSGLVLLTVAKDVVGYSIVGSIPVRRNAIPKKRKSRIVLRRQTWLPPVPAGRPRYRKSPDSPLEHPAKTPSPAARKLAGRNSRASILARLSATLAPVHPANAPSISNADVDEAPSPQFATKAWMNLPNVTESVEPL